MYDAVLVRGSETCAQLLSNFEGFVRWQPADAAHQRSEIFAIHKFHGQKRKFGALAGVSDFTDLPKIKDPADVGMRNLPRKSYFAREPLQRLIGLRQRARQKFQRHGLAEF